MSDPFAKWRRRQADRAPAGPAAPTPVAQYKTLYLNRGWSLALVLVWTPVVLGLIVLMVIYEREFNEVPYSTGLRVLFMLLLLVSLALVPLLGPTSRRQWMLWPNAVEFRERPYIPLFGRYRRARLAFADIAIARKGELLSGMELFELEAQDGRRFRLLPTSIGSGKSAVIDHGGFADFIETIRETIRASGVPVPPGEELHTVTSGLTGVIILSIITGFFAAGGLAGAGVLLVTGEAIGLQIIGFTLPFALLFGGLLRDRWRKWRAGAA